MEIMCIIGGIVGSGVAAMVFDVIFHIKLPQVYWVCGVAALIPAIIVLR